MYTVWVGAAACWAAAIWVAAMAGSTAIALCLSTGCLFNVAPSLVIVIEVFVEHATACVHTYILRKI